MLIDIYLIIFEDIMKQKRKMGYEEREFRDHLDIL